MECEKKDTIKSFEYNWLKLCLKPNVSQFCDSKIQSQTINHSLCNINLGEFDGKI